MNQQIDDTERDLIFQRLKQTPENNLCFDCNKKNPKWCSVNLGLYLCLDCAGKHREYGPQITFVRSLNLDTWNKRYMTFMELGGNVPALAYFTKHGLKAPFDYKNSIIQKYKADLTKKVEAVLETNKGEEASAKPIYASKPVVEETKSEKVEFANNTLLTKSFSDKPKHGEKEEEDPFMAILNKDQTTTKGFTVEFNKNKPTFGPSKGRLAAKKIDNIDLDKLSLNEEGNNYNKPKFDMMESAFGATGGTASVKEIYTKSGSPYTPEVATEEKLKKFSGAKAISSDAFRNDNTSFDAANARKFVGASAISSAQYFGEKEPENDDADDYYQTAENVRDFISTVGGKLKEKADGFMSKLKSEW